MARYSIFLIVVLAFAARTSAEITIYNNQDAWQDAIGTYTTITFQELPNGTWVSNQYSHLGITFDFNEQVYSQVQSQPYFVNDGWGLNSFGDFSAPVVHFATGIYGIAVHSPSPASFWLGYQSAGVGNVIVGGGYFKGIISTLPFDEVRGMPQGIDDLHFGPPIPGPGALGLCGVVLFMHRRRRR